MNTRRNFLSQSASGFGMLAFSALSTMASGRSILRAAEATNPLAPKVPPLPARAKRVIFLSMTGGPSHVDTFDHKPRLNEDSGQTYQGAAKWLGSPFSFERQGKSGLPISELFPHVGKHADDLCLVNSMHTDIPNHPQAQTQLLTGNFQFVRPSLGAWTLYGLGTENESLPGFVTLAPPAGANRSGSSFLPAIYQGTPIGKQSRARTRQAGTGESPIPNLQNKSLSPELQRMQLDYLNGLNRAKLAKDAYNPQVEGLIESYELAFRMQTALPDVLDLNAESAATKALYGIDETATAEFGKQCLSARRLAEAGVRFIQLNSPGWDHHRNLEANMRNSCGSIDKPIAGLLADLKQRDMLKDTLVIWAGEFGRTPYGQSSNGRDHNHRGFSLWMAGGGVQGGLRYGETDDYGHKAVADKVHIHDWHATILHLLGLDHEKLTYRYAGRDFRLTDVSGEVVSGILA